jgi:UPF0755 protein
MKRNVKNNLLITAIITAVIGIYVSYTLYDYIYAPNISIEADSAYFHIKSGSDLDTVISQLKNHNKIHLKNENSFNWVAEKKKYQKQIHAGRYLLKDGMNNNELVNLLRSGKQVPVKLKLNNHIKKKEKFISEVSHELEVDSAELSQLLNDETFLSQYQLNSENAMALFIANTYEFYWNTSANKFVEKMGKEYNKFWNAERLKKAQDIGLQPSDIIILASIIQHETGIDSDRSLIAGVYMNRLHKNMPLQADPTLIWATANTNISRVWNEHKEIESPYNTYKYSGLPPGPICLVNQKSIDAVLNYQKHNYFYFCAKEDFSGYSNFSETYTQHQLNAKRYQKALNERGIR